jgi:acetyl-CoA acetyltransferase
VFGGFRWLGGIGAAADAGRDGGRASSIGASGGRIVGTMVHELRRNGGGLGLAAICSGGGQGDALLIEV